MIGSRHDLTLFIMRIYQGHEKVVTKQSGCQSFQVFMHINTCLLEMHVSAMT